MVPAVCMPAGPGPRWTWRREAGKSEDLPVGRPNVSGSGEGLGRS